MSLKPSEIKYYSLSYATFSVLAICSIDFLTPTLPSIAAIYQLPNKSVQLSLAAFFTCYALSTIPFAYLSEKACRYKVLKTAILISFLGHLICGLSGNYWQFFLGRCLAGMGAGGLILSVRCIQADRFISQPAFYQQVTVWITIWTGIFSDGAKIISASLIHIIPWYQLYLSLCIVGMLAFIVVYHHQKNTPLTQKTLGHSHWTIYRHTFSSRLFLVAIGCYALANGGISLILSEAQALESSRWLFISVASSFIVGRCINLWLIRRFTPIKIIFMSLTCLIISLILQQLHFLYSTSAIDWFIAYGILSGIILPNSIVICANLFGGKGFSFIYASFSLGSLGLISLMCYINILFNHHGLVGLSLFLAICSVIVMVFLLKEQHACASPSHR